jgi:hypothetical protein
VDKVSGWRKWGVEEMGRKWGQIFILDIIGWRRGDAVSFGTI